MWPCNPSVTGAVYHASLWTETRIYSLVNPQGIMALSERCDTKRAGYQADTWDYGAEKVPASCRAVCVAGFPGLSLQLFSARLMEYVFRAMPVLFGRSYSIRLPRSTTQISHSLRQMLKDADVIKPARKPTSNPTSKPTRGAFGRCARKKKEQHISTVLCAEGNVYRFYIFSCHFHSHSSKSRLKPIRHVAGRL